MPPNPTTEGPVKSLRQAAPGGDIIPAVFAGIAALLLLGVLRNPPVSAAAALIDVVLMAAFAAPAYVLYAGARGTGLFVSDDSVEYRALGRVRASWKRAEVSQVVAMSGGVKVLGPGGNVLGEYRFRWWNTEQVARFARAAGLAPPTALEIAAAASAAEASTAEVDPGKAGEA